MDEVLQRLREGDRVVDKSGIPFMVKGVLGQGRGGAVVYLAVNLFDNSIEAAVKYPAGDSECQVFTDICSRGVRCLGVPELLGGGEIGGSPFLLMERLGRPISELFLRLHEPQVPVVQRWQAICLVGRMLLRRLEALHCTGVVHCDVSPGNILLSSPPSPQPQREQLLQQKECGQGARLALVDFGCARRFPGGHRMKPYWGTVEFSSIRALEEEKQERGPFDDLESLGWLLCHGLMGELPWGRYLDRSWKGNARNIACNKVREEKLMALQQGWGSFGMSWIYLTRMPVEITKFLWQCRSGSLRGVSAELPRYDLLAQLLGARELDDIYAKEAEQADAALLAELLAWLAGLEAEGAGGESLEAKVALALS